MHKTPGQLAQLSDESLAGVFFERKAELAKAQKLVDEAGVLISERARLQMAGVMEGTHSQKSGNFKITVGFSLNRKLDAEKLKANWARLPGAICEAVSWKAELSVAKIRGFDAPMNATLQEYITETKEAKPSVKVEYIGPAQLSG